MQSMAFPGKSKNPIDPPHHNIGFDPIPLEGYALKDDGLSEPFAAHIQDRSSINLGELIFDAPVQEMYSSQQTTNAPQPLNINTSTVEPIIPTQDLKMPPGSLPSPSSVTNVGISIGPGFSKKSHSIIVQQPPRRKKRKKHGQLVIIHSAPVHTVPSDSLTPEKYLLGKLFIERGYDTTLTRTLMQPRFQAPLTKERFQSYTTELVEAVRSGNIEKLQDLKSRGSSMSACNKFGESVLHMAARKGEMKIFAFLMNSVDNIYITDDQGRTILHDACWSATPNFDVVTMILQHDETLLRATDVRGSTPLAYIKRDNWQQWYEYLDRMKETFWPSRISAASGDWQPNQKS